MSKQRYSEGFGDVSEESEDDETVLPPSYIVIRLNPEIEQTTLEWLVHKIKGKRRDGGAELIVLKQPYKPSEGVILHISASNIKFLEAAEEMEIMKSDKNGQFREFTVNDIEEFLPDGMHVEDLFTTSERQSIIRHELENIRALTEDNKIPGYNNTTLYEGQSIIHVCLNRKIIKKLYPLHDKEELKKLGKRWYLGLFRKQPFEEIRLYFGEAVALYFRFIGFYTTALLVPTCLGFLQLFVSKETVPFFCIFNVAWVTVFLETWKRKSNELAFQWGTIGMTSLDEPRANFRGQMVTDAVSGRVQPQYPRWKTNMKMYCGSLPLVLLCMLGAFFIMLSSFWIEDYLRTSNFTIASQLRALPSILYTALVHIMNMYYKKLATYLTEWENHRTQSQFDRHRVTKLVLFEFVNNFMSLFYIAFVIQDMDMLRYQLATMLIILQAINNFQEAVLPLIIKFYMTKIYEIRNYILPSGLYKKQEEETPIKLPQVYELLKGIPEIGKDDPRIEDATKEGKMERYDTTYDDYLEMFIQFGYVVLFSSVYPVAAFWAVVNNILEIRADAFKLCLLYQRPMNKRVKDIGAWQKAFEIMGALSILTNCGLLCLSPQMRKSGSGIQLGESILMFVLLEHFLLGLRYLLHITIPDKPEWVRIALAKKNYESKQALKNERMQKNRRILTRKFKTVHGNHASHPQSSVL